MYARTLIRQAETRRFTVTTRPNSGWEVRDESDRGVIRCDHYDDWHRVERALRAFAIEARSLSASGWVEA
jgi:hypothetical protein